MAAKMLTYFDDWYSPSFIQVSCQTSSQIQYFSMVATLLQDKVMIEKIQRRFNKMIPSLRNLPYETRLEKFGLWTLENRRVRADLIEVYKITHGLSSVSFSTFFEMSTYDRTRGHSLKTSSQNCLRQHFFSERVINIWNKLDNDTVCASSLYCFKRWLEKLHKDESFHRLLQSVWLQRLSQSPPLVRPHLLSYPVSKIGIT